jgi:hypothetical protein
MFIDFTIAEIKMVKRRQRFSYRSTATDGFFQVPTFEEAIQNMIFMRDNYSRRVGTDKVPANFGMSKILHAVTLIGAASCALLQEGHSAGPHVNQGSLPAAHRLSAEQQVRLGGRRLQDLHRSQPQAPARARRDGNLLFENVCTSQAVGYFEQALKFNP